LSLPPRLASAPGAHSPRAQAAGSQGVWPRWLVGPGPGGVFLPAPAARAFHGARAGAANSADTFHWSFGAVLYAAVRSTPQYPPCAVAVVAVCVCALLPPRFEPKLLRTQFYGIVERANAIIGHFRPVARLAVLAQPRLGPPLLAKAVFAMESRARHSDSERRCDGAHARAFAACSLP
jgi:hypothetical protein